MIQRKGKKKQSVPKMTFLFILYLQDSVDPAVSGLNEAFHIQNV